MVELVNASPSAASCGLFGITETADLRRRHRDKESGIFLKGYGDDGGLTLLQPAQGWRHTLANLRETMTDRFRIVLGTDGARYPEQPALRRPLRRAAAGAYRKL